MLALANLMLTTAANTRLSCLCSPVVEIDKSQFSEYTRTVCDSLRKVNVNELIWWVFHLQNSNTILFPWMFQPDPHLDQWDFMCFLLRSMTPHKCGRRNQFLGTSTRISQS